MNSPEKQICGRILDHDCAVQQDRSVSPDRSVYALPKIMNRTTLFTVAILPAEQTDMDALAALMHASIHDLGPRAYTQEQLDAWSPRPRKGDEARQRFAGQTVFLASDDEGYAAFMTLKPIGYLDFAYAHPRAAGKGAAAMVHEALISHARTEGLTRLTSDISMVARPFFEKRDWRVIREQQPVLRDVALTNFHMHKDLTP